MKLTIFGHELRVGDVLRLRSLNGHGQPLPVRIATITQVSPLDNSPYIHFEYDFVSIEQHTDTGHAQGWMHIVRRIDIDRNLGTTERDYEQLRDVS